MVPVTDSGVKQLRIDVAGTPQLFAISEAATAVGFPIEDWPPFVTTPAVKPTYQGPATMLSFEEASAATFSFAACCTNAIESLIIGWSQPATV